MIQPDPDSGAMASGDRFAPEARAGAGPAASVRQRIDSSWALMPIVAASGFAGLGYEIVWTRQLSLALGSEMMAVLGAVAGFFAGLALGAFVLDRPIRRARSPRTAYVLLEAVIGLWGLICVWLLPVAGRALSPLLGTEPAPALLWAASFALPTLVLLPATAAMGGTLTALERIVREARGDPRVSAGIYGANTLGAVAGTLISTFLLLPAWGLSGTLICLAGVNAVCALGMLALGSAAGRKSVEATEEVVQIGGPRLTITLFATGLLGIAFEILVVRLAAQVMQDTIYTFAGLLAAYLLGTAAGGLAWQRAGRRVQDASLGGLLAGTALACLTTAFLTPYIARIAETAEEGGLAGELVVAMALFLVPSAAMGALFGLLAQRTRDQRGSLGWAVGINSVGASVAPLLTAQVVIPTLGAWTAIIPVVPHGRYKFGAIGPSAGNAAAVATSSTASGIVSGHRNRGHPGRWIADAGRERARRRTIARGGRVVALVRRSGGARRGTSGDRRRRAPVYRRGYHPIRCDHRRLVSSGTRRQRRSLYHRPFRDSAKTIGSRRRVLPVAAACRPGAAQYR